MNKNEKLISICRYSFDAWMECFPDSDEEEWIARTVPLNTYEFLYNFLEVNKGYDFFNLEDFENFKIVTIDDEYFKWLNDNNLKNTSENRNKYANSIDEENALRLLEKNELNYIYTSIAMPVCIYSPSIIKKNLSLKLTDKIIKDLNNYLNEVFEDCDIFLPGYIVRPDELFDNVDVLYELADNYFISKKWEHKDWNIQKLSGRTNLVPLMIPFLLRGKVNSAIISKDELLLNEVNIRNIPEQLVLNQEGFEEFGIKNVVNFDKTFAYKEMMNYFKLNKFEAVISDELIATYEIPDFMDDFYESLESN